MLEDINSCSILTQLRGIVMEGFMGIFDDQIKHYNGREHAFVKHKLLETYLTKLFMIVGRAYDTICYVDCFSGPWLESSDDLMDTSIGISLDIMAGCRETLSNTFGRDVKFRALYIEKEPGPYAKLCEFLDQDKWPGVKAEAINGEFLQKRPEILSWCGNNDFAFFFVDPKGYTDVSPDNLAPLLQRPKSEFLINFMYSFTNRFVGDAQKTHLVKSFFGRTPDVTGMNPKEREHYLLKLYKNRLKRVMSIREGQPRFAYVSVLDPLKNRTKYEMIYLTRNALGIIKFLEASELVERYIQPEARLKAKEHKSSQGELFSAIEVDPPVMEVDVERVKRYWLKVLSTVPENCGCDKMADMHEDTGLFVSDFQRALKELIAEGKVENLDMKGRRTKNFVNFETNNRLGERLRIVV